MTDLTAAEAVDILVEIKPAVNVDWIIEAAIPPTLPAACDTAYELRAAMDAEWGAFADSLAGRPAVLDSFRRLCAQWEAYRAHLVGCEACRVEAERLRIERMGEG